MDRVLLTSFAVDRTDGGERPVLLWRPARAVLAAASTVLGGGLGPRHWALSATVDKYYAHPEPPEHLRSLATAHGLDREGIGFLTAVDVRKAVWAADGDAEVLATVGLGWPTWAAAPQDARGAVTGTTTDRPAAGTINLLVWVPVRLADGALVNAVATATEAKAQALAEQHVPGTGTASDAIAVCCPLDGPPEAYGGPRSTWGAHIARAVYAAVTTGAARR